MILKNFAIDELNFDKMGGLLPAVVQDINTKLILMLGFVNKEALQKTIDTGLATFYSRSRKSLWTKGETSGNFIKVIEIATDCDKDSLIFKSIPTGDVCHLGRYSCFEEEKIIDENFIDYLQNFIRLRKKEAPEGSYVKKLFDKKENKIIQKVGEEAVETIIAAKNNNREEIIYETADLIFHLLVMLEIKDINFSEIIEELKKRHKV